MKNKMRLVRIAEEGGKAILHGGLTESMKKSH